MNLSHKEVAKSFLNLVIEGKIREAYNAYVSSNFRHHNAFTKSGRESLILGMEEAHTQFPNKVFEIQRILADDDLVAVHSRMKLKPDMAEMAVVHIFRFEGDLIAEMWDVGQLAPNDQSNEDGIF